jgi:Fic family protein
MDVNQICLEYLNMKVETAKRKPDLIRKLIIILQAKKNNIAQISILLNMREVTVKNHLNNYEDGYVKPKPISEEQLKRINKYLKLD